MAVERAPTERTIHAPGVLAVHAGADCPPADTTRAHEAAPLHLHTHSDPPPASFLPLPLPFAFFSTAFCSSISTSLSRSAAASAASASRRASSASPICSLFSAPACFRCARTFCSRTCECGSRHGRRDEAECVSAHRTAQKAVKLGLRCRGCDALRESPLRGRGYDKIG
jgi:hypothetical protein